MEPTITSSPKSPFPTKIVLLLVLVAVIIAGAIVGVYLVGRQTKINQKAAISTGVAKIYLSPETKTVKAGESFSVNVLLDSAGQKITAITVDLSYPYSGSTAPLKANDVQISPGLSTDTFWKFPIKTITDEDGRIQIKIGGLNSSEDGYQTQGEEVIATITFKGETAGTANLAFNTTTTKLTNKDTGEDILLTPRSSGLYTVSASQEATATPTSTPSASPSPSTRRPTETITPSPVPVPDSGVSMPTVVGIGGGILFLIGALMLAI